MTRLRFWFDAGGIYVFANIRGGGEFGEEWHQNSKGVHKQNVFDDFIASADLIHSGYTSPGRLAIEGGSNGGLLMGGCPHATSRSLPRGRLHRRHLRHVAGSRLAPTDSSTSPNAEP